MSSYFSNLLTTTTSRYDALRKLIPSNSEQDGDTEDDTHLCRVLRAYYIEKGRPFPTWLPPDPKAPQPVVQPIYTPTPVGAGYGGLQSSGGQSKLGSLWDAQPTNQQPTAPPSLRPGRGPTAGVRPNPYTRPSQSLTPEPTIQPRPLPSQKAGSIQAGTPPGSAGSGSTAGATTAQDRLKARLWGSAKANAQVQGQTTQQNRSNPTPAGYTRSGDYDPYASGGGYDERSRSIGNSWSGGGGGSRGGVNGTNGNGDRPFVAATAPWASNEDEFMGGGYGSGREPTRYGLPSGPAAGKRAGGGGGLPGGPRGMR